jgi:hypothetical protein
MQLLGLGATAVCLMVSAGLANAKTVDIRAEGDAVKVGWVDWQHRACAICGIAVSCMCGFTAVAQSMLIGCCCCCC